MSEAPSLPAGLVDAVRNASRIAAMTGAGISADSGIPTFRDALSGLWAHYDPSELATPEAFERDPSRVTRWYDERRCQAERCTPNAGHTALATLERRCRETGRRFTLITQNVDRLHQRAGSENVLELHGSLCRWRCTACGEERETWGEVFETYPPLCGCGGPRRPGVVWFGETLPRETIRGAQEAVAECDLFLSIGTSGAVMPAAALIADAKASWATVVEVNPHPTRYASWLDYAVAGRGADVLPALADAV